MIKRLIDNYIELYLLSDGPKDFVMSCFINRFLVPLKYRRCEYCQARITKKPLLTGLWITLTRADWLCGRCANALEHTHTCKRWDCMICDIYNDYLDKADATATVERLLKSVGL